MLCFRPAPPQIRGGWAQLYAGEDVEFVPGIRYTVAPSPATHAILAQLKAGETVYLAGELPKTLRVSKIDYEPH